MLRFTLRRDPYGRLSACADGPSGRDVDCRVHVGIRLMPAGYAPEHRLALTVVRCAMPTDAAALRRVRRVHLLDSSRGLVLQPGYQVTPAVGQDAPIQSGFGTPTVWHVPTWSVGIGFGLGAPGHLSDPQVFHPDHVESPRQVGAGLLHPVLTTVTSPRGQLRDRGLHPLTPLRTATASGQAALQLLPPGLLTVRQTGARQEFTGGQRRRHGDAAIHADDLTRIGCGDRRRDHSECQMPAPHPITGHPVRLRSGNRAGQPQPNPADLRHVDRGPLPVQLPYTRRLIADNTESLVHPGSTPRRAPVGPCVEAFDRAVEVPQRLLLHGLRSCPQPPECSPRLGQLPRLLDVPRRRTFVAGPHRPLLKSQVPQVPGMPTLHQQRSLLSRRRVHPEPGHATYPISPDRQCPIPEGRQSRFLSALNDGVSPRLSR